MYILTQIFGVLIILALIACVLFLTGVFAVIIYAAIWKEKKDINDKLK